MNFVFLLLLLISGFFSTLAFADVNVKVCNTQSGQYSLVGFNDDVDSLNIKTFNDKSVLLEEQLYKSIFSQTPVSENNFINLQDLLSLAQIQSFSDGLLITPKQGTVVLLLRFGETDYSVITDDQNTGTKFLGKTTSCSIN